MRPNVKLPMPKPRVEPTRNHWKNCLIIIKFDQSLRIVTDCLLKNTAKNFPRSCGGDQLLKMPKRLPGIAINCEKIKKLLNACYEKMLVHTIRDTDSVT